MGIYKMGVATERRFVGRDRARPGRTDFEALSGGGVGDEWVRKDTKRKLRSSTY
jgi:hypothetical protein